MEDDLRGGERGILKAVASKAQNLPAKSLDGQIKTAKFYLLMPNKGYFRSARKAAHHANYRDRSSHNSRRFVRIVTQKRKETLRKFSGLPVFLAFAHCVQFGVGDDSYVRAGGAVLILFFIFALAFFEL